MNSSGPPNWPLGARSTRQRSKLSGGKREARLRLPLTTGASSSGCHRQAPRVCRGTATTWTPRFSIPLMSRLCSAPIMTTPGWRQSVLQPISAIPATGPNLAKNHFTTVRRDSRQHKNYRLARCAKASAARQSISNMSCAPASAVMPPTSKGGETSTTSAPTMSIPRNPCSSRLAS